MILFHDTMINAPNPPTVKLSAFQTENVQESFKALEIVNNDQKQYLVSFKQN